MLKISKTQQTFYRCRTNLYRKSAGQCCCILVQCVGLEIHTGNRNVQTRSSGKTAYWLQSFSCFGAVAIRNEKKSSY